MPCSSGPLAGSCASTRPSWLGSVTSCVSTVDLKPASSISCCASASASPVTFGTSAVCGPFETVTVTFERCATLAPGGRILRDHGALRLVGVGVDAHDGEAGALQRARRVDVRLADDARARRARCSPCETLMRTCEPLGTTAPGAGLWPVTVPLGCSE